MIRHEASPRGASERSRGLSWAGFPAELLFRVLAIAALTAVLAGVPVRAEGFDRGTEDKYSLSAGTFLIDFNTHARLDSETLGRGTDIDFEDALGLTRSQSRFRMDGYWRITDHQRLDFAGYF